MLLWLTLHFVCIYYVTGQLTPPCRVLPLPDASSREVDLSCTKYVGSTDFMCVPFFTAVVIITSPTCYIGFPPSPVQNVTVISHMVKGNILELNVSWVPPMVTNGDLWRYSVYVWHLSTPDEKQSIAITVSSGSAQGLVTLALRVCYSLLWVLRMLHCFPY